MTSDTGVGQVTTVRIAAGEMASLRAHAERSYPEECCGVLLGLCASDSVIVTRVVQTENSHQERPTDRFEIAPEDLLRAMRQSRADGSDVVGYYHSHPDHPATPSSLDQDAAWPEVSYLIVRVAGGRAREVRSWRKRDGGLLEERVDCTSAACRETAHG